MATRREFLAGAAGICLTASIGGVRAAQDAPRLMSAARIANRDGGALWRPDALTPFELPARGHALAHLPDGRVLLMGRRPGLFASMIDPRDPAAPLQSFAPAKACRFAGHAAVSPDGTSLVTSEFDAASVEAVLVARDPGSGAERARWRPGGIEPHEPIFARSGARLVAALGGLIEDGGVTGPIFNPGGVRSAVVELDPLSGKVLARHALGASFASLSLRHLAVAPDGETIAVAAQDQDVTVTRPLMSLLRLGKGLELLPQPDPRDFDFRGYIGSIAVDRSGEFVAAASPRGGLVGFWSMTSGRWCGGLAIADVCGVTAASEGGMFWASSGLGGIAKIAAAGPRVEAQWHTQAGFDNHLLLV